MHFSSLDVSIFIAVVGVLSIVAQMFLGDLMRVLGAKKTIIVGLTFEMLQLVSKLTISLTSFLTKNNIFSVVVWHWNTDMDDVGSWNFSGTRINHLSCHLSICIRSHTH